MKFCQKCGKELLDEAVICTGCGCDVALPPKDNISNINQTGSKEKFCTYCGNKLLFEAVICPNCGCSTGYNGANNFSDDYYITELSKRIKINGIIWICIACIQIVMAVTINWFLGIVGVLNIISSIKDLNYSKEIFNNRLRIVNRFEPLTGPIIVLIYNLVFGGIIGVAGSIYYLVGIRSFVLNNREIYLKYDIAS